MKERKHYSLEMYGACDYLDEFSQLMANNTSLVAVSWIIVPMVHRTIYRKQIFSGYANQLQSCVYRKFRVMSGHKCKLLWKAQSVCIACSGA